MGWTHRRRTKNGGVRYRACYRDLRSQIQAAGTFSTEREVDRAWQRAETRLAEGRLGNPRRGRQTFRRYVTEEWLPHHVMETTTREGLHLPAQQAHHALVQADADERDHGQPRPRV